MGKQNGGKSQQSGQTSGQLQAFFPPSSPMTLLPAAAAATANMAPADTRAVQTAQITKNDLIEIKNDLKQYLTSLIDKKLDPLMEQLTTLSSTIKDVVVTANTALEGSEKNGRLIRELRASDRQLQEWIAWLEQRARALN